MFEAKSDQDYFFEPHEPSFHKAQSKQSECLYTRGLCKWLEFSEKCRERRLCVIEGSTVLWLSIPRRCSGVGVGVSLGPSPEYSLPDRYTLHTHTYTHKKKNSRPPKEQGPIRGARGDEQTTHPFTLHRYLQPHLHTCAFTHLLNSKLLLQGGVVRKTSTHYA